MRRGTETEMARLLVQTVEDVRGLHQSKEDGMRRGQHLLKTRHDYGTDDAWMSRDQVAEICPSCADKMASCGISRVKRSMIEDALEASQKTAAWDKLPKGWTDDSVKKMWGSLTSRAPKHKVSACMKKMDGKVSNPGAFCASLADKMTPGWRSEKKKSSVQERVSEATERVAYGHYRNMRGDPRWMKSRYPGVAVDGTSFDRGDDILYWPRMPKGKNVMVGDQADDAWTKFQSEASDEEFMNPGGRYGAISDRIVTAAQRNWDNEIEGKQIRFLWDNHGYRGFGFLLEEMPSKGKRKLAVFTGGGSAWGAEVYPEFNIDNVMKDAKINKGMSYDKAKSALESTMLQYYEDAQEKVGKPFSIRNMMYGPRENHVFYLEVEPPDTKPFKVSGKDFAMTLSWDGFKVYSPDSDLGQSDPSYSVIEPKSKGAARKTYKVLKANPDALKNVSWSDLTDWFRSKKIGYDMHFSVWH